MFVELLGGDLFQRGELIDAGVVDQHVEAAQCFFDLGEDIFDIGRFGDVALDGDCFAAFGGDVGNDFVGGALAGGIVEPMDAPLAASGAGDLGADSFGCAGDEGDFAGKFRGHLDLSNKW